MLLVAASTTTATLLLLMPRHAYVPHEIIVAAKLGELQPVVNWLQTGGVGLLTESDALVDALAENGLALLHVAAGCGQLRTAKELLQRGASVDLRDLEGSTPLMMAALSRQHAMVRLLLECKASIDLQDAQGLTALTTAAWEGDQESVQELLQAGANTELRHKDGLAALHVAEDLGHAAIAELIRQHAATPPASVAMALPDEVRAAAYDGKLQPIVEWLQKDGHVDALTEDRVGLLHAAATDGHLRVVEELLRRGASVDLRGDKDVTALITAAISGQRTMLRLLLKHKASIDLQSTQGASALMLAAYQGSQECVQELLAAGASTELLDGNGHTALETAESRGHTAIVELIQQHAATSPAAVAAPTPSLSARRVRIGGLKARPELNGRRGVAGRFDAAKDRYEVAVEGEAEAVLLKPANLQFVGEASAVPPSAEPELVPLPKDIGRAAVRGELQQMVEWLQQGGPVDTLDEDGVGLLHAATTGGHLHVATELLLRGASIDLRAPGDYTALILAAGFGHQAVARLLLEYKASIDLQNEIGGSALMLAAEEGWKECVQELLEAGANTELHDRRGITALVVSEANGHAAIAKLLRQHATRPPATVAAPTPNLSGRRVRIDGLKARPELNGRCGVAGHFNAAKGRYEVAVGGEAEAVLLKPANLQDASTVPPSARRPCVVRVTAERGRGCCKQWRTAACCRVAAAGRASGRAR